ncbi:hypothetical protein F2Q70_00012551 [Brassica cretica]|uniref:Uncharacterized protein n=1 Tax=Brassica cretica TaxID=69181 RepID=A0A8S9MCZ5_BRACR|nr:hypothetical protein F2Q70_00012551 [Brassica cretica]
MLKQILESQTRSEKHIGYELKNLHTKVDGSYNDLNNMFSNLASNFKALENQFASMSSNSKRPMGSLPRTSEQNPKETMKSITLRSGELPGHLDQGDLFRERSISIRVGVALPDGGSYSWEPLYHRLHSIDPLGEHLHQVSDHRRLRFRFSIRSFLIGFRLRFAVFHVVGLGILSVGEKYPMKRLIQLPASRFLPPSLGSLPSGRGPFPRVCVPASSFWLQGQVIYPALG